MTFLIEGADRDAVVFYENQKLRTREERKLGIYKGGLFVNDGDYCERNKSENVVDTRVFQIDGDLHNTDLFKIYIIFFFFC